MCVYVCVWDDVSEDASENERHERKMSARVVHVKTLRSWNVVINECVCVATPPTHTHTENAALIKKEERKQNI